MLRTSYVAAAALLLCAASPLAAQAVIAGRVVVDSTGAPLAGAEISLRPLGRSARSDDLGRYRLANVPAGTHQVVVRRIGFQQLELPVRLAAGDTLELEVALSASVQTLAAVAVEGERAGVTKLREFERRRAAGFGRFITRAELERREASRMSDVLRTKASGLRFVSLMGGGYAVANGRASGALDPSRPQECFMSIYVDGMRVYSPGQMSPENHKDDVMKGPNIDRFAPNGIGAIEVYRGPAETPPEFQGSNAACGTVVIWTRIE